jgi:hypothetical protein
MQQHRFRKMTLLELEERAICQKDLFENYGTGVEKP